jgi:hypothetical protein
MAIQINIRDVPEKVRDELVARAALQGKSMQEFLRAELERLAAPVDRRLASAGAQEKARDSDSHLLQADT